MGDDVFRDDPTVLELEARVAALAGWCWFDDAYDVDINVDIHLVLVLMLMLMLTFLVTSPKLKFFSLPFVNCLFESHQNMNNESSCHNVFPRKRGSTLCPKWNDGWVNGKHQKLARTRLNVQLCSSQADKRKSDIWILREGKYICFRLEKKNGEGENSF